MSDADYDALKLRLRDAGSAVAAAGPRCSLRSKRVVSDASIDYFFLTALNVPAVVVALLLLFSLDDLSGFEITQAIELPEPASFLITWLAVIPAVALTAVKFTSMVTGPDPVILTGPCPNCGVKNSAFFGDLLGVAGAKDVVAVKCACGRGLKIVNAERLIELQPEEPPKPPKKPGGPKGKAAAAAAAAAEGETEAAAAA